MPGALVTRSFGPFTRGTVDTGNPAIGLKGALRVARGVVFQGASKLVARTGTVDGVTLNDDTRAVVVVLATRAATGGSLTTLDDSTRAWVANEHAGRTVEIMAGPGAGQRAVIVSNSATEVVVAAWAAVATLCVAPTAASTYRIVTISVVAAPVSRVVVIVPFADGALAVGWSSATAKAYLYKLASTMDGWYDTAGTLHAGDLNPEPLGALWTTMTSAPEVSIAEGLGFAYIAHAYAADAAGLYWPTKTYNNAATIATLQADLDGGGAADVYFAVVASFAQALFGAGFGAGAAAATGYRPEMVRFSPPSFTTLQAADSITIGNRVRSQREKVVALGAAGGALFVGAPFMLTRVTGFGRNSYDRRIIDEVVGVVGGKAWATDGTHFYFWSQRGPARASADSDQVEPLWLACEDLVKRVVNQQNIVAVFDEANASILWFVDVADGVRVRVAYDIQRALFTAVDDDIGLVLACAGQVDPLVRATAAVPPSVLPSGPPTSPQSLKIGATTASARWIVGDGDAETEVYLRNMGETFTVLVTTLPAAGQGLPNPFGAGFQPVPQGYGFGGLTPGATYRWSVRHKKGGQFSAYLGPDATTEFTTLLSTTPLLAPTGLSLAPFTGGFVPIPNLMVAQWFNSGETLASTEVYTAGPSATFPTADQYALQQVVLPGVASASFFVPGPGTYYVKVRHVRAGFTTSLFAGPAAGTIFAATVAPPIVPPSAPRVAKVGTTTASVSWVVGDGAALTEVYLKDMVTLVTTLVTTLAAAGQGIPNPFGPGFLPVSQGYGFTLLTAGRTYQWSVRHSKAGVFSVFLGPDATTQFTTSP